MLLSLSLLMRIVDLNRISITHHPTLTHYVQQFMFSLHIECAEYDCYWPEQFAGGSCHVLLYCVTESPEGVD
jgi:hypothetical protein